MKKTAKFLCFALAVLMAAMLVGCADGQASAPAEKTYTVGVCQLVQHEALDAATKGFTDALKEKLGDRVSITPLNASGDSATCSTICNQFVGDEVDLIMANATPALLAAQASTNKIPVLGTSITDYGDALGIDDFTGKTGTNISGTSDRVQEAEQAKILQELFPNAKTVGMLFCSTEPNSRVQADAFRIAAEGMGYTVSEFTFADSNDVAQVTKTACDECEVLYIPTDNVAASNKELINNVAVVEETPIVVGEEGLCAGCGVATLSISYYDLGKVTGEMAYEVLVNGADPATMEIRYASAVRKYNPTLCEKYNLTIPEGYEPVA